jgi:predicted acetyltransferase
VEIELATVAAADKLVLTNLMQLYLYDFSEFRGDPFTPHGTFGYHRLDHYFTAPARDALFIRVDGLLAGFTLARGWAAGEWNIAEFFVARAYRRRGVADAAARQLFARHPGVWSLAFDHGNAPAAALWRKIAKSVADGPVEETEKHPPEAPIACTWLRFAVSSPP